MIVVVTLCLDHLFLLFHLSDTYFFFQELIKTQSTSQEEADLYEKYSKQNRSGNRFYGRALVMGTMIPYGLACFKHRGIGWKVLGFYGIVCCVDAMYDAGMYIDFFIHGPKKMRQLIDLDPKLNFASIQARLYVRHCASIEMKKARGELPKKSPLELCIVKSFRNQLRDTGLKWRNSFHALAGTSPSGSSMFGIKKRE